ncbi:DUF4221 family protein [Nitritalea halalkaliphila]|nr:DUF4221 family protein [Nitritalea halalkaliphila]
MRFIKIDIWHGVIFLFSMYNVSCNEKGQKDNVNNVEEYLTSSLTIPLDSISNFEFNFIQSINSDDGEELVNLNKIANTLDFYKVENGELISRIFLNDDEKFGRFTPQGFYYHNEDSIFIFPQMTLNGTLLLDKNGEIQKKYLLPIPEDSNHPLALNHPSVPSSPTIYHENKLYAAIGSLKSSSHGNGIDPNTKIYLVADLLNNEIIINNTLKYPKSYHNRYTTNHHITLLREYVKNEFIISSYPLLDSLYIHDMDFNLLSTKVAKSKFFEGFKEIPKNTPVENYTKYIVSESSYGRLIYDPYKKLYYRFVLIGRFFDENEDSESISSRKNNFSVLVLNKDFELLNEIVFPGSTYSNYSAFVGKKGLYLPKINSYYKNLSEDYITYDIFDFEKKIVYQF